MGLKDHFGASLGEWAWLLGKAAYQFSRFHGGRWKILLSTLKSTSYSFIGRDEEVVVEACVFGSGVVARDGLSKMRLLETVTGECRIIVSMYTLAFWFGVGKRSFFFFFFG